MGANLNFNASGQARVVRSLFTAPHTTRNHSSRCCCVAVVSSTSTELFRLDQCGPQKKKQLLDVSSADKERHRDQRTVHLWYARRNTNQTARTPPSAPSCTGQQYRTWCSAGMWHNSQHERFEHIVSHWNSACFLSSYFRYPLTQLSKSSPAAVQPQAPIRCRNDITKRWETTESTACTRRARCGDWEGSPGAKGSRESCGLSEYQRRCYLLFTTFFVNIFFRARLSSTGRKWNLHTGYTV